MARMEGRGYHRLTQGKSLYCYIYCAPVSIKPFNRVYVVRYTDLSYQ